MSLDSPSQTLPAELSILRFFAWEHLPPNLQEVSRPFDALAQEVADRALNAEASLSETAVALRKLLEAKDAAVRAVLP